MLTGAMGVDIVLHILLGLVFLFSATPKLRHPRGFVLTVLEYRVLPRSLGLLYARLLPPLELLVALLLLSGTATRAAAILASLLLASFIAGIAINLARGRDLDCGCFGGNGRRIGWRFVLRDVALLGASLALAGFATPGVTPEAWPMLRAGDGIVGNRVFGLLMCAAATICCAVLLESAGSKGRKSGTEKPTGSAL